VDTTAFRPAKLLITIVGKYSGELVLAASKRGGARGGTKAVGRGLAQYFTGGDNADEAVTEALLFTLMYDDESDNVVREVLRAGLEPAWRTRNKSAAWPWCWTPPPLCGLRTGRKTRDAHRSAPGVKT